MTEPSSRKPPSPALPPGLPIPQDDGACDHLRGMRLPDLTLMRSSGRVINLSDLKGLTVIYIYPMSGADDSILPDHWDAIPGARGCTPQACSFRDHAAELKALGAQIFGLATQPPDYLKGEVERIHLPYELISDEHLALTRDLSLPVFDVRIQGKEILKRVTLICEDSAIVQVFYPVFPPDKSADQVIAWLRTR